MKILTQSSSIVLRSYAIEYVMANDPEISFVFPCSERGVLDYESMAPAALDNLMACQDGSYEVDGPYLVTFEHRHAAQRLGQCDCGEQVVLDSEINTCPKCATDYTLDGAEVPRLRLVS